MGWTSFNAERAKPEACLDAKDGQGGTKRRTLHGKKSEALG